MAQMHTIVCPSLGRALALSLILEHEGFSSVWTVTDGKPTVTTMAPPSSVRDAISFFQGAARE